MPKRLRPLDGQVARLGGAAAQDDGVEFQAQLLGGEILADLAAGHEADALGLHQPDAALDQALVELHVGDAVHQEAADAVGALEDGDPVPALLSCAAAANPARAGADDRTLPRSAAPAVRG